MLKEFNNKKWYMWQKFAWTTVFSLFGWALAIQIFAIEVVFVFLILLVIFQFFDYLTWYLAARKNKKVNSEKMRRGIIIKWLIIFLSFLITISVWVVYSIFWIDRIEIFGTFTIKLWMIPFFYLLFFIIIEFFSIIENMAIITNDDEPTWKVFWWVNFLTKKFFNTWASILKDIGEKKINYFWKKTMSEKINDNIKRHKKRREERKKDKE